MSWNISQLAAKHQKGRSTWNAVSWKSALLGVPSNGENRVRRRFVEFLVFNSICMKKNHLTQYAVYAVLLYIEIKPIHSEHCSRLIRKMGGGKKKSGEKVGGKKKRSLFQKPKKLKISKKKMGEKWGG